MLSVVGGLTKREMCDGGGGGGASKFPVYNQVINNFINLFCVELRPASDHFISSPWVRYCSGSIINLIYIWLL